MSALGCGCGYLTCHFCHPRYNEIANAQREQRGDMGLWIDPNKFIRRQLEIEKRLDNIESKLNDILKKLGESNE